MQLEALSEIMKSCGVVGAGGAGFPSYAKLNKKADTVILNCAECEPLFKVHRQLLAKYAFEILTALEYVREAVEADRVIVAVKPSYSDAIEAVKERLVSFPSASIHTLPEVYPAGDEVITVYETTGRVVPPGNIPISVGCIVYNVETMLNTYYAVKEGRPVTKKYVTVGGAVKNPTTYHVPLGVRFSELIKLAGGETIDDAAYLSGGVMTGNLAGLSESVTKTTNAVLVFPQNHPVIVKRKSRITVNIKRSMSSCCQCRTCTDLCPRNLLGHPIEPHLFMRAASKGTEHDIKAVLNTAFCAQCGVCEMYACPQGLAPKTLIGEAKTALRSKGIKFVADEKCEVNPMRQHRYVQMRRLLGRLGLETYAKEALISEEEIDVSEFKIMMKQHIGAPAVAYFAVGDFVNEGDKLADVGDKLGCGIYSPVSGEIIEKNDEYLVIRKKQ